MFLFQNLRLVLFLVVSLKTYLQIMQVFFELLQKMLCDSKTVGHFLGLLLYRSFAPFVFTSIGYHNMCPLIRTLKA